MRGQAIVALIREPIMPNKQRLIDRPGVRIQVIYLACQTASTQISARVVRATHHVETKF